MIDVFVIPLLVLFMSYMLSNEFFSKNARAGATVVASVLLLGYVLIRIFNG